MSMETPRASIDAATSHTGAWKARRKNGGTKPKVTMVAASRGKAGRSRIAMRLPVMSPMACAVMITDHARAPP